LSLRRKVLFFIFYQPSLAECRSLSADCCFKIINRKSSIANFFVCRCLSVVDFWGSVARARRDRLIPAPGAHVIGIEAKAENVGGDKAELGGVPGDHANDHAV
jgi:hypothetical protein